MIVMNRADASKMRRGINRLKGEILVFDAVDVLGDKVGTVVLESLDAAVDPYMMKVGVPGWREGGGGGGGAVWGGGGFCGSARKQSAGVRIM